MFKTRKKVFFFYLFDTKFINLLEYANKMTLLSYTFHDIYSFSLFFFYFLDFRVSFIFTFEYFIIYTFFFYANGTIFDIDIEFNFSYYKNDKIKTFNNILFTYTKKKKTICLKTPRIIYSHLVSRVLIVLKEDRTNLTLKLVYVKTRKIMAFNYFPVLFFFAFFLFYTYMVAINFYASI